MDALIALDEQWTIWLNGFHVDWLDIFMQIVSHKFTWIPLYIFLLYTVFLFKRNFFWCILVVLAVQVACTDLISVHGFKNVFERLRPCYGPIAEQIINVGGHCGGKFGFVSSHAANVFGVATFMTILLQQRTFTIVLYSWATLVSYSRVYLGVHYLFDIVGGALLGLSVGWCLSKLLRFIIKKM